MLALQCTPLLTNQWDIGELWRLVKGLNSWRGSQCWVSAEFSQPGAAFKVAALTITTITTHFSKGLSECCGLVHTNIIPPALLKKLFMGRNFTIRCLGLEILTIAIQLTGGTLDLLAIRIFLVVDFIFSPGISWASPTLRLREIVGVRMSG